MIDDVRNISSYGYQGVETDSIDSGSVLSNIM